MSLIDLLSTGFTKLVPKTETDSSGNVSVSYADGDSFTGALVLDSSSEVSSRLVRKYTLTVSPEVEITYGDIIRRDSDSETFLITGDSTEKSPEMATFSFRQLSAEDYEMPSGSATAIIITDGSNTVTLPAGTEYSITRERIGSEGTASDGSTVLDILGYKVTVSVSTVKLSKAMLGVLVGMIENSPFLSLTYPDISGSVTADFLFEMPELKAFEFDEDGVSEWYGITLTATGKEVA